MFDDAGWLDSFDRQTTTDGRTDGDDDDDAWGVDVGVDVFVVVWWWSGASVVRLEGARRRRRWAALGAETEAESACARELGGRTTTGRRGDVR